MGDHKDELNNETSYSLEEILAEYRGTSTEEPKQEQEEREPAPRSALPKPPPQTPQGQTEKPRAADAKSKVIPFPGASVPEGALEEEESPITKGVRRLREGLDQCADQMFEAEAKPDPKAKQAEKLIPGVDRENTARLARERKPRPAPEPVADLTPDELFKRYSKGLGFLRFRMNLVFLLALPQLYIAMTVLFDLPLPTALERNPALCVYLSAAFLACAVALSLDVLVKALVNLMRGRAGMDALTALAAAATLADSLTMLRLDGRDGSLPYCGTVTLCLFFVLRGTYLKQRALRLTCRTANATSTPYLVTLDENKWSGKDAYAKWAGPLHGFGAQIQGADGAERVFRIAVPLLLCASLLFSLISSLGHRQPEHLIWCFSAMLTAAASYSGLLCFGLPMDRLSVRLSGNGAALAGWEGARWAVNGDGILLTDTDFFPPGAVTMNGIKVFGDYSVEKVVGVTATLVRDSGSGLDKVFHDLLRTQGAVYRRAGKLFYHEGGGVSADIRGEQVLIGSAALMTLMEIPLPKGLNIKNAVFCSIDGELAGVFALNYSLPGPISPALSALIQNKISPILATRDFNIIPAMLRQRFKLPVERMEFPPAVRRRELSDTQQAHSDTITAVLCREGLGPFSEAVVGAGRLRRTVLQNTGFACAGAVAGVLIAFYLTFQNAYASLSAGNLTIFLLLWTVPTFLISSWVDKY